MLKEVTATTIDNPFNPFNDFDSWFMFDIEKGYYTVKLLLKMQKMLLKK